MPLYRCLIRQGLAELGQREQIARDVVRVHCEVTGAPASFVHAFFDESAEGELPDGKDAFVLGSIRAGRTAQQKESIVAQLKESIAGALNTTPAAVDVITADVPATWNMEGGELLPEPGEEAAWLERHRSPDTTS